MNREKEKMEKLCRTVRENKKQIRIVLKSFDAMAEHMHNEMVLFGKCLDYNTDSLRSSDERRRKLEKKVERLEQRLQHLESRKK